MALQIKKLWSVDYYQKKDWKNSEEEVLIADSQDNIKILYAKEIQFKNWITQCLKEIKDNGQKVMSVWWVITQKFKGNKMTYKARLVVRGLDIRKVLWLAITIIFI